jgi:3-oxoadipate enol-lactonase
MWSRAITAISATDNISVITADMPGFGDAPLATSWTMESAATELHAELLKLGIEKVSIAGLSMGGYVALAYAKLFTPSVQALILSDTKSAADTDEAKKGRETFALDAEERGAIAAVERMYSKLFANETFETDRPLALKLENWMLEAKPAAIAAALRAMALRTDTTEFIAHASIPTLLISGEADCIIPIAEMKALSEKIPNSHFEMIANAGHLASVEQPAIWMRWVLDFVAAHSA